MPYARGTAETAIMGMRTIEKNRLTFIFKKGVILG